MNAPQLKLVEAPAMEVATIATSAVLIDLRISTWTGRKRDKNTTAEVTSAKKAGSDKAASVIKNLMSDDTDLDKIRAYAQDTRLYLHRNTLAWGDKSRLLPTGSIFEVTGELEKRAAEFDKLVATFVATYSLKVSAAAFKLGQLFKREEYPTAEAVAAKFRMSYNVAPVPTSGDFRVDVQNDVGEFLRTQYERAAREQITEMMREPWERAYETLAHAKERLKTVVEFEPEEGGDARRAPKLFESMLDNAVDMANLLDKLNITSDPKLADCAARIRRLFSAVDIKSLRESKELQKSTKQQVDDILDMFDFGGFGSE
jgi:hypothetical protein